MKKLWNNRRGAAGLLLVMAVLVAVALTAVIVVAAFSLGGFGQGGTTYKPPSIDQDGDGVEDPIIGYLYITADAVLDNRDWFGAFKQYIGDISGELRTVAPPAEIFQLDLWAHDVELKMKFYVSAPQVGYEFTTYDEEGGSVDDSHRYVEVEMHPNDVLAVRYHGSYQIVCTLMDMEGNVLDTKTTSMEV